MITARSHGQLRIKKVNKKAIKKALNQKSDIVVEDANELSEKPDTAHGHGTLTKLITHYRYHSSIRTCNTIQRVKATTD